MEKYLIDEDYLDTDDIHSDLIDLYDIMVGVNSYNNNYDLVTKWLNNYLNIKTI